MWWTLIVVAAILGLANATVGNVLKLLSLPLMIFTLGLFGIVINALMLQFAAWLSNGMFGTGFYVDGFWPAFWAAIIISIVSAVLGGILGVNDKDRSSKHHKR
jgi:putative membrane protein